MIFNPFKFVDIVRKGKAILIKYDYEGFAVGNLCTINDVYARMQNLRQNDVSELDMVQELLAVKEYNREVKRDVWDTTIEGEEG